MVGCPQAITPAMSPVYAEPVMPLLRNLPLMPPQSTQAFLVMLATSRKPLGQALPGILIWCLLTYLPAEAVTAGRHMMEKMALTLPWIVPGADATGLGAMKVICLASGIDGALK